MKNPVLEQTGRDDACPSTKFGRLQAGNVDLVAAGNAKPVFLLIEGKLGGRDPTHLVPLCGCNADGYWSSFASCMAENWSAKDVSIEV